MKTIGLIGGMSWEIVDEIKRRISTSILHITEVTAD